MNLKVGGSLPGSYPIPGHMSKYPWLTHWTPNPWRLMGQPVHKEWPKGDQKVSIIIIIIISITSTNFKIQHGCFSHQWCQSFVECCKMYLARLSQNSKSHCQSSKMFFVFFTLVAAHGDRHLFKGQLLFSLNKCSHHLKTAICIFFV